MKFRHVIGVGILYAGVLYLYSKCCDLQTQLTFKSIECELYKAAYETESAKNKSKGKPLKKKDEG